MELLVFDEEKPYSLMDREIARANVCKRFPFHLSRELTKSAVPMFRGLTRSLAEMFEDEAAPMYPPRINPSSEHGCGWIAGNEVYRKWRDAPQPGIMHVFGSEDASAAAEYAFQDIEASRDVDNPEYYRCIQYFKFVRHDVRRNTIRAMAETFLAQMYGQWRIPPLRDWLGFQESPDFNSCWSAMDALCFVNKVRIQLGSSVGCTWILDGLDQCVDGRDTFLAEISNVVSSSEQFFGVFITSAEDSGISQALYGHVSLDVRQHPKDPASTNILGDFINLANLQPELYLSLEDKIRELLSSCNDDEELRLLIIDWLNKTQTGGIVREIQCLSPPSPAKVMQHIIQSIPTNRRLWAQKVIALVLYAFRPLCPEELNIALAMDQVSSNVTVESASSLDIMEEIGRYFGRLLVLENGEVALGHPAARGIISAAIVGSSNGMFPLGSPQQSHSWIADTSLRYLTLPSVRERIIASCKASKTSHSLFEGRSDFTSYGMHFWARHYRLGPPRSTLDGPVDAILRDPVFVRHVAAANWYQLNPFVRADRAFLSPLPILASLGLEQLVVHIIESQSPQDEETSMALTEAAREGHGNIVEALLRSCAIAKSACLEACKVAARSGQAAALEILVKHVTANFKDIQWPQILLSRVAFLHLNDLLETLLEARMNPNPRDHSLFSPPLHCAIASRNCSGVEILLKHGADPALCTTRWKNWPPMLVAAKLGHFDIIEMLIRAGASVDARDDAKRTPLSVAALCGNHKALQVLLDSGADKGSAELSCWEKLEEPVVVTVASMCYIACLRLLLKHGVNANVDPAKTDRKTALQWVASQGRADLCRLLIENGVHLNGSDMERPLVDAVESRSTEVVQVFLEHKADVNVVLHPDSDPSAPLIAAAKLNLTDIAKLLLENGADVNLALANGHTALFTAANEGHAEMTKLLIDAGADLSKPAAPRDHQPLHACNQHAECLKILLDAGADINAVSKDGTVAYMAAYWNHPTELDMLIARGANLEITSPDPGYWDHGCTALMAAANQGHAAIVETLLEAGADINAKMPDGSTALMLAAKESKEEAARALLEYNPDINVTDNDGWNCLHHIDENTPLSLVRVLVRRGVDLEQRTNEGYTVLRSAVEKSDLSTMKYLLDRKANINTAEGFFGGPLHIAALFKDVDAVRLLVDRGGDVNLLHRGRGGTPLMIAYFREDCDEKDPIVRYLVEEAGADVNAHGGFFGSALNMACLTSTVDLIKVILDKVDDKAFADNLGRRPIHCAAIRTVEHVQLILDAGGDLRSKNSTGQTPLHLSVGAGHVDLVEYILSRTPDLINDPDKDGWTPLHWACRPSNTWSMPAKQDLAVIKLLLAHGADISAIGQSHDQLWAPFKLATYFRASDEILELLKPKSATDNVEEARDLRFYTSHRAVEDASYYCDGCLWVSLIPFIDSALVAQLTTLLGDN
jgi:ankyrin repeat protein